jgi:hypothetical protein
MRTAGIAQRVVLAPLASMKVHVLRISENPLAKLDQELLDEELLNYDAHFVLKVH